MTHVRREVGDGSGLESYIAMIGKGIKKAWIDGWPTDLLSRADTFSHFTSIMPAIWMSAASRATEKVFTGLRPAPPDDYSHPIMVKVLFEFGRAG